MSEKALTPEEAIKTAMEFETRVRDTYAEALEKATNEVGKRVFRVLAMEEQGHLDYLEYRLKELKEQGKVNPVAVETQIPPKEVIEKQVQGLKSTVHPQVTEKELDMLKAAVEAEMQTSAFYRRMVEQMTDENQQMFQNFLEIEEGHVAIVQAELDAAQGMGHFFGFEEFNMEAG